ncbi:MAG: hypothetical protein ACI9XK_004986 [Granulosicoccus sp.]|jgi:hypothetical protein
MTSLSTYELNQEQSAELRWLRLVNLPILGRSAVIAVILGGLLTSINQPGWIAGTNSFRILPLILMCLTPFAVVMVAQVVRRRQANIDFNQNCA